MEINDFSQKLVAYEEKLDSRFLMFHSGCLTSVHLVETLQFEKTVPTFESNLWEEYKQMLLIQNVEESR